MLLSILNHLYKFTMSFSNLSSELVEMVASFLEVPDLRSLRLTSPAIANKTSHILWKTALHTRKTDLSATNLTKLEDISDTTQARYVRHLTVKGFDEDNRALGEGLAGQSLQKRELALIWLLVILIRFNNCTSFEVDAVSDCNCPIFSSTLYHTEAISLIMAVITVTSHPVTSFTVNYRNGCPDISELAAVHVDDPRFRAGWAHLRDLRLNHTVAFPKVMRWMLDVIICAPNLRILYINLNREYETTWLTGRLASANIPWPYLEELHLKRVRLTIQDLSTLLRRCRNTLRVLALSSLDIESNSTGDDLQALFRSLADFPALETIHIKALSSNSAEHVERFVHFPALSEDPAIDWEWGMRPLQVTSHLWVNANVRYSGARMGDVLRFLAGRLELLSTELD